MTNIFNPDNKPREKEHREVAESEVKNSLKYDAAEARKKHAEAADQETLTKLKEDLAHNVLFFMWIWCGLMFLGVMTYFTSQLSLNKEIPKEVILGMFTATTVVVGLVGFILKGLFGNGKEN
jgi:cation transport ATPase